MAFVPLRALNGGTQIPYEFALNDSQTITVGELCILSGAKLSTAGDAAAAGTVAGVAMKAITTTTAAATDIIPVDINPQMVYRASYSGSATPAIGTAYDNYDGLSFDSDDSTDGYIMVVGNVDSTGKYADVMISNRFNAVG